MIVKPSPGHDQRPPLTQRPLPLSLPLLHSGPSPRSSPRSLTAPVSAPRFSARARVSSSSSSSSSASLGRPLAPSATTPSFRRRDDCRAGQGGDDDDDDDDEDGDGKEGKNSKREPLSLPSSASHAPTSASAAAAEARPLPLSPHSSHPASAPGHDLTATATTTTTTTTRIPSPSSSTSPPSASSTSAPADDGTTASMAPQTGDHATLGHPFSYEGRTSVTISPSPRRRQQQQQQQQHQQQHQDYHHHEQLQQQPQQHHHQELHQQPQKQQQQQQPSPPADDPPVSASAGCSGSVSSPQPLVTRLRDLAHMQVLASADLLGEGGSGGARYDISGMPIGDIIKMVAALLTKITAANDLQHDALQRNATQQQQQTSRSKQDKDGPEEAKAMNPLNHSVLAFHGKNVPAITILNYLSRIHKYCPTTYEVFLSLLVYFDRMTERVNELVLKSDEARRKLALSKTSPSLSQPDAPMADGAAAADDGDDDDDDDDDDDGEKKIRRESISETVVREVVLDDEDGVDGRPRRQLLFDNTSDLADDEEEHDVEDDDGDDEKTAVSSSGSSNPTGGRIIFVPDVMRASVSGPTTFFVVDSFNIHRLVIAGVTCASKFFSDVFYTNSRYAKVGGLPLAELNHLEIQFLVLNDFRLAVSVEDLEAYATMLVEFYAREMTAALSPAAAAPALTSGPGYDDAKPAPGLRF